MAEKQRVVVACATGWAGSALARGIARADDLQLVAAVARASAGRNLGEVLNEPQLDCAVHASAAEALDAPADVFVEYTKPDAAKANVIDAPSGPASELAGRLGRIKSAALGVPLEQVRGQREARGATLNDVQVHSVRTPGFVIGIEAVFGAPGQRLHIRHESGESAGPYVGGAPPAIRRVHALTGVHRGLDTVMKD